MASLQKTLILSDEASLVDKVYTGTYEMKCSIEVSTSACLRDFRKEDNPGVAAFMADILIVHQAVVAQEFARRVESDDSDDASLLFWGLLPNGALGIVRS